MASSVSGSSFPLSLYLLTSQVGASSHGCASSSTTGRKGMCWAWRESKDESAKALGPKGGWFGHGCNPCSFLYNCIPLGASHGARRGDTSTGRWESPVPPRVRGQGLTPEPLQSAPGFSPAEWGLAYPSVLAQPASSFGTYFSDTHQFSFAVSAFLCLGDVFQILW